MRGSLAFGFLVLAFGCTAPGDRDPERASGRPEVTWPWCASLPQDSATFLPGLLSLPGRVEQGITFSPTGDTLVVSVVVGRRDGRNLWALFWSSRIGEQWTTPDTLPFSGTYSDYGPAFAPDGRTLYFSARRPIDDTTVIMPADYDLWKVMADNGAWSGPVRLADGINTTGNEYSVGVSREHLVICADRHDALGRSDLFIVDRTEEDNPFAAVVNMGKPINSPMWEGQAAISADGRQLWWNHVTEDEGASEDILWSVRAGSAWSAPERSGPLINTSANEFMHVVSPDGRWIFFGRHGDILSAPL